MLILLPPSEGKTAPVTGPPLDFDALSFPRLNKTRRAVSRALVDLCRNDAEHAVKVLGLGPRQADEIARNVRLGKAPAAPAIQVYSGVVYEALDYSSLSPAAKRRADSSIVISSALWGLLRPTDAIPAYRLSGSVTLPTMGTMASVWHSLVSAELQQADGVIVDLRSGTYASLGPVAPTERAGSVRVLLERNGRRTIVSHHNKATKGRIARALVSQRKDPKTMTELAQLLGSLGYRVEPTRSGLDVIVADV